MVPANRDRSRVHARELTIMESALRPTEDACASS
jgi:hypothetical protein